MKKPRKDKTEQLFEDFFGFTKPKKSPSVEEEITPPPVVDVPTRPSASPPPVDSEPPENWNPPVYMACGHWQIQFIPRPLAPGEEAYSTKGPSQITLSVTTPEECHYCRKGIPGDPMSQTGAYRTPVSKGLRRSKTRPDTPGWPGYCCDDDGYYIGGLGNNCLFYSPDHRRCEVHRGNR